MTLDPIRMLYTPRADGTPHFASRSAIREAAAQLPSLVGEIEALRTRIAGLEKENARLRGELQKATSWQTLVKEARATAAHAASQETAIPAGERS